MTTRRSFLKTTALGAMAMARLEESGLAQVRPADDEGRPQRKWPDFTTRPVIMARRAAVTAGHYLAAAAGFRILASGGNAFDAAVAMGFVSSVVEPQYFSIGGEVAILIYSAKEKKVWSVSGQGTAPAAATVAWFRQHDIDPVPSTGFLPATVPAAVAAWLTVLERWGSLRLHDVLTPAIELAETGYPAHSGALGTIESALKLYPSTAQVLRPPHTPEIAELLSLPDWAATFRRLLKAADGARLRSESIRKAKDLFYRGEIAARIVDFVRNTKAKDSAGEHNGLLTSRDLAEYETPVEEPVSASYRGRQVYKCGPWTQGPVFLQQLKLLEGFDLRSLGHNSPNYIHTLVEAAKLAYADRDAYYGDPRFVHVPLDRLLSDAYAAQRRQLIDPVRASMELRPGGGSRSLFFKRTGLPAGFDDTTHLDACDEHGNMIAATPSGGWINMSPIIPGLGFPLSVRGQMFWLDPQHPNCIQPGKRPRTTITPSLVLHDGQPILAFGTLGGDDQDQWTLQFFLNYLEFGMNLQEALDAPTFNTEHFHESWSGHKAHLGMLSAESRITSSTLDDLRDRGHKVTVAGPWANGRVLAVRRDVHHRVIEAAASPRAETGYALGW